MKKTNVICIALILATLNSCKNDNTQVSPISDELLIQKRVYKSLEELSKADEDSVFVIDLSNSGLEKFPKEILKFKNLQVLKMNDNSLDSLPEGIGDLNHLQKIEVRKNNLVYVTPNITKLKYLNSIAITDSTKKVRKVLPPRFPATPKTNEKETSFEDQTLIELAFLYRKMGEQSQYDRIMAYNDPLLTFNDARSECKNFWGLDKNIPVWEYKRVEVGYITNASKDNPELMEIASATSIEPDLSLKNKKINVVLSYLRAFDYPGKGLHNAFLGYNASVIGSTSSGPEKEYSFNQNFQVNEGDEPSLKSIPVFNGLNTGEDGILITCDIFNVDNENDKKVSKIFEAGKKGLEITGLAQANPAIGMVTGIADEALKIIRSNHENIPVHEIKLGLTLNNTVTDLKLKKGSYVIMGVPNCKDGEVFKFDWKNYKLEKSSGKIQEGKGASVKLNYIVFTIS